MSARTRAAFFATLVILGGCAAKQKTQRVAPPEARQAPRTQLGVEAPQSHEELAKGDSLEFLRSCRQHYLDNVRDYRCKFNMREGSGGGLGEQQVIAVKFRENPYSVDMTWVENPAGAKRISYVQDRWVKDGRQLALVVPSGFGGIVVPGGLKLDIHGKEFQKSSSRSVDQFGFRKTLERAIQLCEQAKGDPAFSLKYAGRGDYEGRAQYILERRLPYSEGGGTFPDRLAIFFIDVEWLTPTAVWSYADEQKQRALGEFITTDVEFNVGFTDADFE